MVHPGKSRIISLQFRKAMEDSPNSGGSIRASASEQPPEKEDFLPSGGFVERAANEESELSPPRPDFLFSECRIIIKICSRLWLAVF